MTQIISHINLLSRTSTGTAVVGTVPIDIQGGTGASTGTGDGGVCVGVHHGVGVGSSICDHVLVIVGVGLHVGVHLCLLYCGAVCVGGFNGHISIGRTNIRDTYGDRIVLRCDPGKTCTKAWNTRYSHFNHPCRLTTSSASMHNLTAKDLCRLGGKWNEGREGKQGN